MLKNRTFDRIACAALAVMLAVAACMWGLVEAVQGDGSHTVGYENLLFDQSRVHTIEITMSDWDGFIQNAVSEEYTKCDIALDGEKYNNVAIRAKGNTSLSSVSSLGSARYSFKVEFDHYMKGMTYHGLDKLSLNNLIQDASLMKDYLAYTLMGRMGVPAPLCSYVYIRVNGEDWGLYLAVEGVEGAFLERNGMTKGELYKPDSMSFGGGRGNGRDFDIEIFRTDDEDETEDTSGTGSAQTEPGTSAQTGGGSSFGGFAMPSGMSDMSGFGGMTPPSGGDFSLPEGADFSGGFSFGGMTPPSGDSAFGNMPDMSAFSRSDSAEEGEKRSFGGMGGFNFGMGSEDVKLIYSDDDPDSYSNIFNNAKTKITKKDKKRLINALKNLNAKEDLDSTVNKNEVITYLAVHNFLVNDDSYTGMMVHNYYLYEENGKLSIIPWDYNLAFGGFSSGSNATSAVNSPIDSPVTSGTVDSRPLIAWIFSDEEAQAAYHAEYSRFLAENVENGWLASEIARVKEMISPYFEKDPSAFYGAYAFEKAVSTLQTFCEKRGESVRGQQEGTIPSTSAEQRKDQDDLLDAAEISTGDMGSMSSGGGFGGGGQRTPSSKPESGGSDGSDDQTAGASADGSAVPSGLGDMSGFTQGGFGGMTPPSGSGSFSGMTPPSGGGSFGGMTPPADGSSFGGSGGSFRMPPSMPSGSQSGGSAGDFTLPSGTSETLKQDGADPSTASKDASADTGEQPMDSETGTGSRPSRASAPSGFSGGFPGGYPASSGSSSDWIMLAVCAAVLLLGLGLVWKLKNHND